MEQTYVKKKRHFILLVLLLALAQLLVGSLAGDLLAQGIAGLFPGLSDGAMFLLANYLPFIGLDAAVLLFCGLWEKDLLWSFFPAGRGGMGRNNGRWLLYGLLFGFGTNALCVLVAWLHGDIHFTVGVFDVPYMLAALVVVCIQSGAEELLTRGYMMGALRHRYPAWVAILVNSAFFGALHLLNTGVTVLSIVNIILYGVLLSLVVYYFDSLWFCIAMHTAWNFTQNILFGLPNSGLVSEKSFLHLEAATDSFAYDVGFGVEGTVFVVVLLTALSIAIFFLGRAKRRA